MRERSKQGGAASVRGRAERSRGRGHAGGLCEERAAPACVPARRSGIGSAGAALRSRPGRRLHYRVDTCVILPVVELCRVRPWRTDHRGKHESIHRRVCLFLCYCAISILPQGNARAVPRRPYFASGVLKRALSSSMEDSTPQTESMNGHGKEIKLGVYMSSS